MKFSLVVATVQRVDELQILLESLSRQTYSDFEVVIVDQNDDDRLVPIVAAFTQRMGVRHCRSVVKGLSHARNLGSRVAGGEIIGFPDDDCIYPAGVLEFVQKKFEKDPELISISGTAVSPSGERGSGRWTAAGGEISVRTVWTSVIAFSFFIRSEALHTLGGFDETLGVGARFGSAEETDLILRVMEEGGKAVYDPTLVIVHPDKRLTAEAARRAFRYGTGLGRVLRKHRAPLRTAFIFMVRPAGGIVLNVLSLKPLAVRYYWNTLGGRLAGYFAAV
jgi:GT2 family glycosyltransferase